MIGDLTKKLKRSLTRMSRILKMIVYFLDQIKTIVLLSLKYQSLGIEVPAQKQTTKEHFTTAWL